MDGQVVFIPSEVEAAFIDPNGNALSNFDWWVETITFRDGTETSIGSTHAQAKPSWVDSVDFTQSFDGNGDTVGNPEFTITVANIPSDYRNVYFKLQVEFETQGVQEAGFCFNILAGTFSVILHYNASGEMCAVRSDGSRWRTITSVDGGLDVSQGALYDQISKKIIGLNLDPDAIYEIDASALDEALGVPVLGTETELFSLSTVDPYGITLNTNTEPQEAYTVQYSNGAVWKLKFPDTSQGYTHTVVYPSGTLTNPIDVVYYQDYLYITQEAGDIVRLAADGSSSSPEVLVTEDDLLVLGITSMLPRKITQAEDFVDREDKIWFVNSHFNNKAILKFSPDGSNLEVVANDLVVVPYTLAVDGSKVYWSGTVGTRVYCMDHNGSNLVTYISPVSKGQAVELMGLSFDPWDDKDWNYPVVVWGAYNTSSGIKAALNYDGPSGIDLVNIVNSERVAPTYDIARDRLYYTNRFGDTIYATPLAASPTETVLWSDGSGGYTLDGVEDMFYHSNDDRIYFTSPNESQIRYASADGSTQSPLTLYTGGTPRGIVAVGTTLYWTDSSTNEVLKAPVTGGTVESIISVFDLPDLPLTWSPRGITYDSVNNCLFIISSTTESKVYKYNIATEEVTLFYGPDSNVYYSLVCDEEQQHIWMVSFSGNRISKLDIPSRTITVEHVAENVGDNNLGICLVTRDPFSW